MMKLSTPGLILCSLSIVCCVVMLNVVMLSVVAPVKHNCFGQDSTLAYFDKW
jgi:hypothetical protein